MKKIAVIGLLLLGTSFQSFSMGHPHNMFAARKQMRVRTTASAPPAKATLPACWKSMVQVSRNAFSELVLSVFAQIRPIHSF